MKIQRPIGLSLQRLLTLVQFRIASFKLRSRCTEATTSTQLLVLACDREELVGKCAPKRPQSAAAARDIGLRRPHSPGALVVVDGRSLEMLSSIGKRTL